MYNHSANSWPLTTHLIASIKLLICSAQSGGRDTDPPANMQMSGRHHGDADLGAVLLDRPVSNTSSLDECLGPISWLLFSGWMERYRLQFVSDTSFYCYVTPYPPTPHTHRHKHTHMRVLSCKATLSTQHLSITWQLKVLTSLEEDIMGRYRGSTRVQKIDGRTEL